MKEDSRLTFGSILYLWCYSGTFPLLGIDLSRVAEDIIKNNLSSSVYLNEQRFGAKNTSIGFLNSIDRYVIPGAVNRLIRVPLQDIAIFTGEDPFKEIFKRPIEKASCQIAINRNGSFLVTVELNCRFNDRFTAKLAHKIACLGVRTDSPNWNEFGIGSEFLMNESRNLDDIVSSIVSDFTRLLNKWRPSWHIDIHPKLHRYTVAAFDDFLPNEERIDEFVLVHDKELAAIANMDLYGFTTRKQSAVKENFKIDLSIDQGLSIYSGQTSLLFVQDKSEYGPWIPHFEYLGYTGLPDSMIFRGIVHNYFVFAEMALMEVASLNGMIDLFSYYAEKTLPVHSKINEIKHKVAREFESLKNHPTSLEHGLNVIKFIHKQLDRDELLSRFERTQAYLDSVTKTIEHSLQQRYLILLNTLLLSALGIEVADIFINYQNVSPSTKEWVFIKSTGALSGVILAIVILLRPVISSLNDNIRKLIDMLKKNLP